MYSLLELIVHGAIIGLIISIVELYFVHADEESFGFKVWFTHGWHSIPWTTGLTILNLIGYYQYQAIAPYLPIQIPNFLIPLVVFLLAVVKIHGTSVIIGKIGEKWIHCTIVAALIAITPYIYPFVAPYLPTF